eukprot:1194926-Prorocentrum_minimum.AAC.3
MQGKVIQCCDSFGYAAWGCFCTSLLTTNTDETLYLVLRRVSGRDHTKTWEVYAAVTGDTVRDLSQPWNQVGDE